jgi:aldehyde dehydrogenase (NAD+)
MGPVISKKQGERVLGFIEQAKAEGCKLLCGGERLKGLNYDRGWYIQPTLFEAHPNHTIYQQEVFGPVACVTPFETDEQAIQLANQTIYGLAAGIWSKDPKRARLIATHLRAGTVWINEYHLLNHGIPFGGYKQSGLGREMGVEGLKSYLEVKHLWTSDCEKKPWYEILY